MADKYKVISEAAVRNARKPDAKVVKTLKKGKEVSVYKKEVGEDNQMYCSINSGNSQWVLDSNLKMLGSGGGSGKSKNVGTEKENEDAPNDAKVMEILTSHTSATYKRLGLRYTRAFGSPSRFIKRVDPLYHPGWDTAPGRVIEQTWMTDTSIISLCPGKVDYLPGFHKKKKNQFWKAVRDSLEGAIKSRGKKDKNMDLNGQLYSFRSAYKDYFNVVNALCRVTAQFLGIGEVSANDLFAPTPKGILLQDYDYAFRQAIGSENSKKAPYLFTLTKRALNTAVTEKAYIHFYANHTGTSVSESITTEAGKSWLEEQLNGSGLDSAARNIEFLLGGAIIPEAQNDILEVISKAREESELLGGFATIAKNYLEGGRLVFPKMITGMSYDKSLKVEITFRSIYGDKRSIFKQVLLPCLHLLAFATPRQLTSNMYTYPFLVRAYQRGVCNFDLAYINSLEFSRGGSDGTCFTVDGLPTEVVASFNITPLYTNLMVTSAQNPFLFLGNTALLEYLATMTGLDLKANNLTKKSEVAQNLVKRSIFDIPSNLARGIVDTNIMNEIRKFTTIAP